MKKKLELNFLRKYYTIRTSNDRIEFQIYVNLFNINKF